MGAVAQEGRLIGFRLEEAIGPGVKVSCECRSLMGFGPYGNQISHLSKSGRMRTANGWALGGGGPSRECALHKW